MPTMKYAPASEIFEYCQLFGRHFGLYDGALFQTEVADMTWDDATGLWTTTTDRGDTIRSRFVVIAGGVLSRAKLPGIPGIEEFQGDRFHTSRWDYTHTGGSPTEPLDLLADKVVGIIGTGATAVQVVPAVARSAKELFVFQRTPSAVGVRNQGPTDVEWFKSLEPGWQQRADRELHPGGHRWAARGEPGGRHLDRDAVGRHPAAPPTTRRRPRPSSGRTSSRWRGSAAGSPRSSRTRRPPRS